MNTAKPEINLLPFNVWSRSEEEAGQLMSNFAHTPFELDGVAYAAIEGLYVSLLFLDPAKRLKLARLYGLVVIGRQFGTRCAQQRSIRMESSRSCAKGG